MPKQSLEKYRKKRSASGTPEPFGSEAISRPQLFVVQKHDATRLHYDFRLEWGGVLLSWAVPRGPSPDTSDKRLAVHVEDHPVEYGDFEGVIPEGNYGAGAVIVWDTGRWIPLEDPDEGMKKGKLTFELKGYKLRGEWALVRTKRQKGEGEQKEWLLIKHADQWSGAEHKAALSEASVISGLTIEDMRDGLSKTTALADRLDALGAPREKVPGGDVKVMLAEVHTKPFSDPDWLFELKYDGFRLVCARYGDESKLIYRSGIDATAVFPEIARTVAALPHEHFILDGEVCVLDDDAKPSFQRLQKRVQLQRRQDIERAMVEHPVYFYAFDFLAFDGYDLRPLPLIERKELLRTFLPAAGPLRFTDHILEQGEAVYEQVQSMGLEGMVAKRADSTYREGRHDDWRKYRLDQVDDFVVVGYSLPKGHRTGFGALHLGRYIDTELTYLGRVGTGFTEKLLKDLSAAMEELRRDDPPCTGKALPTGDRHVWVEPELVAEVRYKERTNDGQLRQPSLLRIREDKLPQECEESSTTVDLDHEAPPVAEVSEERIVNFTNLDKVFWPEEGYTKGDLIEFYRSVSDWLLPYLIDRPLVLTRYPDGIDGKSFYQKDAPNWVPDWIRLERMWSEQAQRELDYFVCDDVETLTFLVNLGTIPLHIWSSRVSNLARPDWCILDLDPKGAPWEHVVTLALAIKELADEIELPTFVKTSGSTGIHVLLPLGEQITYEQSRSLGEVIARVIVSRHPDISTVARVVKNRAGKVYIDYLQNGHGRLLVSPFCVRPKPHAPVSTTLHWHEVGDSLRIEDHTIATVPKRLAAMEAEPLRGVMEHKPDLPAILARLASLVD